MTTPRVVFDPTQNRVPFAFDGSLAVNLYDLLYHTGNDVLPASSQADQGSPQANRQVFAQNFAGLAGAARLDTDGAVADFPVITDAIVDIDCESSTWEVGDLIGVAEAASGTALESQKGVKVTDQEAAIGYCVARSAAASTRVRCRLISRVAPHEPRTFVKSLTQYLALADFTDNTNATGYADFDNPLPAGALVLGWKAVVHTGFTGDTTTVLQVGVSGDLDDFTADTAQSCLAAATVGSAAQANDAAYVNTAVTPRVTVTGSSDFGLIAAGAMTVTIFYIDCQ